MQTVRCAAATVFTLRVISWRSDLFLSGQLIPSRGSSTHGRPIPMTGQLVAIPPSVSARAAVLRTSSYLGGISAP